MWIMAVVWAAFWIVVTIVFEDPPAEEERIQLQNVENVVAPITSVDRLGSSAASTQSGTLSITGGQIGSLICMCWLAMTYLFVLGKVFRYSWAYRGG